METKKVSTTALILYTKDFKFCTFKYKSGIFSFIHEDCDEFLDSSCPFLSLARHIVTKINEDFSFEALKRLINPKVKKNKRSINDRFSNNMNYNEWAYELSEAYQLDIPKQNRNIYMFEIQDEDSFVKNMNYLGINYSFIQQGPNLQLNVDLMDNITLEILNQINIEKEIKNSQQLKNSPPSKENTYILMTHYQIGYLDSIKKGGFQRPVKQLFYGIHKKDHQKWYTFSAAQGYLPDDQMLKNVKAIIMTGSAASAYNGDPWIIEYKKWIQNVYNQFKQIRILGICFGEQILAHTLNGKCDSVHDHIYNTGTQKLLMKDKFFEIPFVKKLNLQQKELIITKSHGDIVTKIDENEFEVVGSSEKYKIEMYVSKLKDNQTNPRVLCIQGHPEYASEWVIMKEAQKYAQYYFRDIEEGIKSARQENPIPDNSQQIRAICDSFLLY